MESEAYHPPQPGETPPAAGVDAGATLAKLAIRRPDGSLELDLLPSDALDAVAERLRAAGPQRVGLTGGGAAALARALGDAAHVVNEFAAWGSGAAALLADSGAALDRPYLLVSLGTGTSVLLVDRMSVTRVGGTALGGGTLLGLGARLVGTPVFEELAKLAARGRRERVDLRVSDIYRAGEIPLPGDLTAANFGKLARPDAAQDATPEDLAHGIVGLVGENVALVCGGIAAATGVRDLVFGGATLRGNPALREVLGGIVRALGREPHFLERGEFAGALGALRLAES